MNPQWKILMRIDTKLKAGKYMVPCTLVFEKNRIWFKFSFNKPLMAEVKMMEGSKWHGYDKKPIKAWSCKDTIGNRFRLDYLMGKNPYITYDSQLVQNEYQRPLYSHQVEAANFITTRRQCIYSGDMGVGKTLTVIEVMERSGITDWWYVAPKSGLKSTVRELADWDCKIKPELMTYQGMVKRMREWEDGATPPQGLVLDEASKVKNATTQMAQAANALATGMREDHKNPFIILLSGTPATKEPSNWWSLTNIACPGFLREGSTNQLKQTLALTVQQEGAYGGIYNHVITWKDNELKCAKCGNLEHEEHEDHRFTKSVNEVARLHKRMNGLVLVHLKKDCLDLPDLIMRKTVLRPTAKILQLAKTIVATASSGAKTLLQLRMLADGFRYVDEATGEERCVACVDGKINFEGTEHICDVCGGTGKRKTYTRKTLLIDTPKTDALKDCLDELDDIGRIVIYGGFQASIDRILEVVKEAGWNYVKADGRGWESDIEGDHLEIFTKKLVEHPKVAFVGNPGSAGMGLNLQVSPMIVYYSNTFNGEDRQQSMDRCNRIGMDKVRGCTIVDLVALPSDQLILDNLDKKRWLQALTMGDLQACLNQ